MELMHGASLLSRPAEEFGNDGLVEEMWALRAMEHAEVHFNLITSVHPSLIHLTPYDDMIYTTFRQDFPDLNIEQLNDDILKSPDAKVRWRAFSDKFSKLEDYAYGTLMRADASKEFSPENSLLVVRIQFWAIEIARNREGVNDEVHQKFRPPPRIYTANESTENVSSNEEQSTENESGNKEQSTEHEARNEKQSTGNEAGNDKQSTVVSQVTTVESA